MAKRAKSLAQWCSENSRLDLLDEIDSENNQKHYSSDYIPNRVEYNSPDTVFWKCNMGHEYMCEVVGRTLFGLSCPICHPELSVLPIGTKYGCLSIIGGFEEYNREVAEPKIRKFEKEKEDFLNGKRSDSSNIDSVDFYDDWIDEYKNRRVYKCQCKCGRTLFLDQFSFLEKKHRFCTEGVSEKELKELALIWRLEHKTPFSEEEALKSYCGLAVKVWKAKQKTYKDNARRSYAEKYDVNFTGSVFESLEVLECINENYEERYAHSDLRKKDAYLYKIYKLYKCRCYLCGKELEVKCSQFHISPPTRYGATAYNGYWSGIQCDCHKISSFQWIVNKLLLDNNVPYRVEYSFSNLYGLYGTNKLRFDFAILNDDGSVKCLIECQGEQHSMPVREFGGTPQYNTQVKNDERKRAFAQKHNIPLLEISYKDKKYEKVEAILRKEGII